MSTDFLREFGNLDVYTPTTSNHKLKINAIMKFGLKKTQTYDYSPALSGFLLGAGRAHELSNFMEILEILPFSQHEGFSGNKCFFSIVVISVYVY